MAPHCSGVQHQSGLRGWCALATAGGRGEHSACDGARAGGHGAQGEAHAAPARSATAGQACRCALIAWLLGAGAGLLESSLLETVARTGKACAAHARPAAAGQAPDALWPPASLAL